MKSSMQGDLRSNFETPPFTPQLQGVVSTHFSFQLLLAHPTRARAPDARVEEGLGGLRGELERGRAPLDAPKRLAGARACTHAPACVCAGAPAPAQAPERAGVYVRALTRTHVHHACAHAHACALAQRCVNTHRCAREHTLVLQSNTSVCEYTLVLQSNTSVYHAAGTLRVVLSRRLFFPKKKKVA